MKKAGYVLSLAGGILAIIISALMVVTGPYFCFGGDVSRFYSRNQHKLDVMWASVGEYKGAGLLLRADLDDYIEDYSRVLRRLDADDLEDVGKAYNEEAFEDAARIFRNVEDYLPSLRLGVIACVIASVIALIGSETARRYRVAGGAMVLSGAALNLIFSLIAGSIITMAPATFVLILGGVLQIVKPKACAAAQHEAVSGGGLQQ